jgi:hypothetical protein
VTERHISLPKLFKNFRGKNVVDKAGIPINIEHTVIVYDNARGLLSAMLQGKEPVIRHVRNVAGLIGKYTKDTALFIYF